MMECRVPCSSVAIIMNMMNNETEVATIELEISRIIIGDRWVIPLYSLY